VIVLAGVLSGAILFLAFRRFMDDAAVRAWKRKRRAYVLSLYLFGDDPLISLRAFGRIARANAWLLLHALPALVIAAPLVGAAAIWLDHSLAPAPAIVTAHWTGSCEPNIEAPAWLRIDSPPVHVLALHEISWRVRATSKGNGSARAGCGGEWVNAQMKSEEPSERWAGWFGLTAWATAWLLGAGERLLRFFA
jgi:hypothetical protein